MSRPLGPRCRTAVAFFPLQINNSKLDGRLLARSADFNRLTPLEHPHDTIKSETPNPTQPITDHGHSSSGSDRTVSAIARFKPTKVGAPSLFDAATLSETHQKPAWCARQKIGHGAVRGFGMTMGGCCPGAPILIGLHHSNNPDDTIMSETPNPTQPITDHGHCSFGSDRTVSAIARFKPTKVGAPSLFDAATLSEIHQKPAWCARQKIGHGAARGFGMTMGGCCPGAPILIGLHHSNTQMTRS